MKFKKGAMFGLDARIALAIFGALSVISGAALYSAIKDAKIVAAYTQLAELAKASEAMFLDMGTLKVSAHRKDIYDAGSLNSDNSIVGWNGPYMAVEDKLDSSNYSMVDLKGQLEGYNVLLRNLKTSGWNLSSNWNNDVICSNSTQKCSLWLQISTDNTSDTLGRSIDEKYDDGVGTTGNIIYGTADGYTTFFIKEFSINSQ